MYFFYLTPRNLISSFAAESKHIFERETFSVYENYRFRSVSANDPLSDYVGGQNKGSTQLCRDIRAKIRRRICCKPRAACLLAYIYGEEIRGGFPFLRVNVERPEVGENGFSPFIRRVGGNVSDFGESDLAR